MQLADLADLYGKELYIRDISKWLRGSARAQGITKRSELDAKNVEILEEHDQFYRDHKLLLTLFRGLAVMPVQRATGKITFSWTSNAMIYAYFFYVFTTILVFMVGYERFDILLNKSKKFDEYIYSIIFIVFLVPHFWIPFVGWGVANEVCDYKNSWGTFQLSYYKVTGENLQFPRLSILIVIISSGCLIVAVTFLLTLSALLEGFTLYHMTAYIHIITMINMNCALWYINCRAIGNASTAFADSFERDVDERCPAYLLAHYRVLWLSLSELLQKLGNAYARTYSTYCLFMMANITVSTYGFTSEILEHGISFSFKEIGLLVDTTYCLTLLYIFCNCSHQSSQGISYRVQTALLSIKLGNVDKACAKEIDLFLIAIKMNPPKVSLKGYTVVNRELLTSSLATIAIYLVVLLQFKMSLVNMGV
ncbi:gustatory and odorant receptor 22-like [Coccinella septempunctata]|uniref:gustatory and odorant receptor 22-like n=1 Tax=Coccinella septempunctata TaxID=41139 RepID=UPI001D07C4E8|nr:gustatory and odorant receptor 22-like [Coccinella septempunctata]